MNTSNPVPADPLSSLQSTGSGGSLADTASSRSSEDNPVCWICLDLSLPLVYPCKCPRAAHPQCLARWQLQSAGTRKETHCEFCDTPLPDWKESLTPKSGTQAPALMNVNFDGRTYSFEVKPGPDGYAQFTAAIRRAFSLPDDSELNITFTCDEPTAATGSLLTLQGPGAYDAAVHCASVSAARRMTSSRGGSPMSEDGRGGMHHRSPFAMGADELATTSEAGASMHMTEDGSPGGKRRLSGFGRKIRTALVDLLSARPPAGSQP